MNSQATLSRELALRIGLAARVLPDTDAKRLLAVLSSCVAIPMTESDVANVPLETLKAAKNGEFSAMDETDLQEALNILGNKAELKIMPEVSAYREGDLPGSIRIACGSDDAIHANGNFANCAWFMVYQVSADEARLVDIRGTEIPDGVKVEDKNVYRSDMLEDCKVVYVASLGGPAAAKLVKLGIHPMKLATAESLANIVNQLQQVMAGSPPPWLAKAMGLDVGSDLLKYDREANG